MFRVAIAIRLRSMFTFSSATPFSPATLCSQHPGLVLAATLLLLVQTLAIAGLLIQRRRRRAAEQAVHEAEACFRFITDLSPSLVWVADTRRMCTWFNKTWLEFTGRRMDQETGAGWVDGIHADDRARCLATYHSHFDQRRPFSVEFRLRRHDGDYRWMLDAGQPRFDEQGQFKGYVGSCLDITERHQTEQDQRVLERQLRQAQKMELIGHLTGGIAHDFNNILAAMFGYAELAQMAPAVRQNPQLSRYLQEILQAGIRAKELVSQLLTFSQRKESVTEPISVAPIVHEVTKLLRSTLPATISIRSMVPKALPGALLSSVHLHQILMNLGINARDAIAGQGSVELEVQRTRLEEARACTSCHANFCGDYLLISVKDDGSGIRAEHLPKIFDPFFTTKEVGHGSGLGLSVLHGIVHSADGHVEVLTAPGHGTEFRVYLPAQQRQDEQSPHDFGADSHKAGACGHVLVVDDEESIVGFMTALLENLGCRVTGLTSATAALALFSADPLGIDMVITDQTMPELTGAELARAMLVRRPDLPIILSTGYSNSIDEDSARQIGIRRLLMKPVPAKILADMVAECLSGKESTERA